MFLDQGRRVRVGYKPPQNFVDQFLEIYRILADSDDQFLDGENPGTFYFLFFGILQCDSRNHCLGAAELNTALGQETMDCCAFDLQDAECRNVGSNRILFNRMRIGVS